MRAPELIYREVLNDAPLSEQLRVAVVDARRAMRDPHMVLNMLEWVKTNGKCQVCLAGAVLYYRCGMRNTIEASMAPHVLPQFAININYMRTGQLPEFGHSDEKLVRERFSHIVLRTFNNFEKRAQLKTYLEAATYLESEGL